MAVEQRGQGRQSGHDLFENRFGLRAAQAEGGMGAENRRGVGQGVKAACRPQYTLTP